MPTPAVCVVLPSSTLANSTWEAPLPVAAAPASASRESSPVRTPAERGRQYVLPSRTLSGLTLRSPKTISRSCWSDFEMDFNSEYDQERENVCIPILQINRVNNPNTLRGYELAIAISLELKMEGILDIINLSILLKHTRLEILRNISANVFLFPDLKSTSTQCTYVNGYLLISLS